MHGSLDQGQAQQQLPVRGFGVPATHPASNLCAASPATARPPAAAVLTPAFFLAGASYLVAPQASRGRLQAFHGLQALLLPRMQRCSPASACRQPAGGIPAATSGCRLILSFPYFLPCFPPRRRPCNTCWAMCSRATTQVSTGTPLPHWRRRHLARAAPRGPPPAAAFFGRQHTAAAAAAAAPPRKLFSVLTSPPLQSSCGARLAAPCSPCCPL